MLVTGIRLDPGPVDGTHESAVAEKGAAAQHAVLNVGGPEHDRRHNRLAQLLPFQGARHFLLIAVIGGHEIRADQQQNHVGAVQVGVDLFRSGLAGDDVAVVPILDYT